LEAPFLAKDVLQQMFVAVGGNAVNFVVGGHDGLHVAGLHRHGEWKQELFAKNALGKIAGSDVGAAFGLAVRGKMLGGGKYVILADQWRIALKAANGGEADARHEIRIFAVRFFGAAPARITSKIENGGEALLRAARTDLERDGGENILDEIGIPRGSERNGLRKRSAARRGVPVKTFFVKKNWNAQTCVVLHPVLNGVGEFGHFARAAVFAGAGNFTEAEPEGHGGAIRLKGSFFVDEPNAGSLRKLFVLPGAEKLRDFFFERHAREKIGDAKFDG
jgi:hypothetical protein